MAIIIMIMTLTINAAAIIYDGTDDDSNDAAPLMFSVTSHAKNHTCIPSLSDKAVGWVKHEEEEEERRILAVDELDVLVSVPVLLLTLDDDDDDDETVLAVVEVLLVDVDDDDDVVPVDADDDEEDDDTGRAQPSAVIAEPPMGIYPSKHVQLAITDAPIPDVLNTGHVVAPA